MSNNNTTINISPVITWNINKELIKHVKSNNGHIDFAKLFDLAELEYKNYINYHHLNNYAIKDINLVLKTNTNKDINIIFKNDKMIFKFEDITISNTQDAKMITKILNKLTNDFEKYGLKIIFSPNAHDFISYFKNLEQHDFGAYGNTYFYVPYKQGEVMSILPIYNGKIKDFSLNKVQTAKPYLIDLSNPDSINDFYIKLIENESITGQEIISNIVPRKNLNYIINTIVKDLEENQLKHIKIGAVNLSVLKKDNNYTWYCNNQKIDTETAYNIIGYAELATFNLINKSKEINTIEINTINNMQSAIINMCYEDAFSLAIHSREEFMLNMDTYEKDEFGNYISLSFVFKEGSCFKVEYTDNDFNKEASSITKIDCAEFIKICEKINLDYVNLHAPKAYVNEDRSYNIVKDKQTIKENASYSTYEQEVTKDLKMNPIVSTCDYVDIREDIDNLIRSSYEHGRNEK